MQPIAHVVLACCLQFGGYEYFNGRMNLLWKYTQSTGYCARSSVHDRDCDNWRLLLTGTWMQGSYTLQDPGTALAVCDFQIGRAHV